MVNCNRGSFGSPYFIQELAGLRVSSCSGEGNHSSNSVNKTRRLSAH
nr:MAG TPA: hypothetical protein [Caudoviricetes sp.]